jgi:hypothetical protein
VSRKPRASIFTLVGGPARHRDGAAKHYLPRHGSPTRDALLPDIARAHSGFGIVLAVSVLFLMACSPWDDRTRVPASSPAAPTELTVQAVPTTSLMPSSASPRNSVAETTIPAGCQARDLAAVAHWQGASGTLVGGIVLTNQSMVACTLRGLPRVQLLDGRDQGLSVTQATTLSPVASGGVAIQPGHRTAVRIQWRNWCEAAPSGPITLSVTLPGQQSLLNAPLLDPDGVPQRDKPRCDVPAAPSILAVDAF